MADGGQGAEKGPRDAATVAPPLIAPLRIEAPGKLPRRPRAAISSKNPWAMVLGSEAPTVVVYDDGTVIRQRPPEGGHPARFVEGRVDDVRALLAALEKDLLPVGERTAISTWTDQPSTSIVLETGAGWVRRGVYGMVGGCRPVDKALPPPPPGFASGCRALLERPLVGEHPYAVETLELIMSGYEHSPERPLPWPASLPKPPPVDPPAQGVVKHFIPGSYLEAARAFLASRGARQAVAWHGHKWSISLRLVVPADDYLDRVNRETWRVWAETVNARNKANTPR